MNLPQSLPKGGEQQPESANPLLWILDIAIQSVLFRIFLSFSFSSATCPRDSALNWKYLQISLYTCISGLVLDMIYISMKRIKLG